MSFRSAFAIAGLLSLALSLAAQTESPVTATVPPLIQLSNVATDQGGNSLSGVVSLTFSLYNTQQGGEPLWTETQNNVSLDPTGHYSIQLGITKSTGVPTSLFTSGEARWLGVRIADQPEQPRVLLLSVPYALKAADAATIGGLPPSAFVKATPENEESASASSGVATGKAPPPAITGVTAGTDLTGGGTTGNVTLNLDITKVPQLATANTFTGAQTIKNTTVITGTNTSGVLQVTNTLTSGKAPAIVGTTISTAASGVKGVASATTGSSTGVYGTTAAPAGYGVGGLASATTGAAIGVFGQSNSSSGSGVIGTTTATSGAVVGVSGLTSSYNGYGVMGTATAPTNTPIGVYGNSPNSEFGIGVLGSGQLSGVEGYSINSSGSGGTFLGFEGTSGLMADGSNGLVAYGGDAAQGVGTIDGIGGLFLGGDCGDCGTYGDGVFSYAGSGYAGNFRGDLNVFGTIFASTKDFKIDHPLDPANKYLVHASVESSEMMNIYTGNVTTDAQGQATVPLPTWFEALNNDFRYQLTVIGQFAQAIVAREIHNHQFQIKTNAPNVKVSWQVTGIRQDAFAKAHPLVVEETKEARLRGFYIHPEYFGASPEKQIEWARHPQTMKQMKARRQRLVAMHAAIQPGIAPPSAQSAIAPHQ